MPEVDSTLRLIGQWKYIITTDLTSAFYQIPLSKESMKYCGVSTPYRGTCVYVRSAMGMPGSETALEELMCRVLGELLQAGAVAKLPSTEAVLWTDELRTAFTAAKKALSSSHSITLPKLDDQLWIVTDGALRKPGIGATLYQVLVQHIAGVSILPSDFASRNAPECRDMACQDERHQSLRDALVGLCIELRPLDGLPAVIRTDPAPGLKALVNNPLLHSHRLSIEIGQVKNSNKNPVAERAVQELQNELLRQDPSDGEMWYQQDQFSNSQLPIDDRQLITSLHETHVKNHPYSEKSKAPHGKMLLPPYLHIGDLIYLYADHDKSSARDRYLIVSVDGQWCNIQKFCGSQIRNTSYRVKRNKCYKVPPAVQANPKRYLTDNMSNDKELYLPSSSPPPLMTIPQEILTPPQKTLTPPTAQPEEP
ncbi:Retrovirus-related Pol poly from transposon opus [Paramuricea clavata]|uniref:Retrovirus-related Pol poly from transposon opus n=1 Tax=Paramuricea clavata TaxID=317549 RepID=A0A7D9I9F6_PARCT|nr:Retrovirus-related Pol poly from transposon opus [Paramuricea clavata]